MLVIMSLYLFDNVFNNGTFVVKNFNDHTSVNH